MLPPFSLSCKMEIYELRNRNLQPILDDYGHVEKNPRVYLRA